MASTLPLLIIGALGIIAVIIIARAISHSEWYHRWVNSIGDEDVTVTSYVPTITDAAPRRGVIYREKNVPAYSGGGWHDDTWTHDDLAALRTSPTVFDEDSTFTTFSAADERLANTFDRLPAIPGDDWLSDRLAKTTAWFATASANASSWRTEEWAVRMPWELSASAKRIPELLAAS